jgi:lipid-binding SYLF domain-containing protein
MKIFKGLVLSLGLVLAAGVTVSAASDHQAELNKRMRDATQTLRENKANNAALSEAKCIAVVPNLTEAALGIGGKHGEGVVTCKDEKGDWSAPAFFSLTGGSLGIQAGIERKDLVILAMNERGKAKFYQKDFDLAAAAEATGGDRSARGDWENKDIAVFSTNKGAFVGANVSGTMLHRDDDAMETAYGKSTKAEEVLDGKVERPPMAATFLREVEHLQSAGHETEHHAG